MHLNKYLIQLLSKYKFHFVITLLIGLSVAIFTVLQAFYLSKIIDLVFLKNQTLSDISKYLVIVGVVSVIKPLLNWLEKSKSNSIASSIKEELRNKLITHIFNLGPNYLKSEKTGEIQNTILNGIDRLDVYFSQFLPQFFLSVLTPILFLAIVFPIDLISGTIFLITAPLIIIFMVLIGSFAQSKSKNQWKSLGNMSSYFLDVIQGLYTIKLFGRSKHILKKIELVSNEFKNSTLTILRIAFLSALVLELFSTLSIAIIAVEIGVRLLYNQIQFQPALFILILAPDFYNPIRQLGAKYHAGLDGVSAAESIQKILNQKSIINVSSSNIKVSLKNDIIFEKVSFSYHNEPTIKEFSLKISEKSHIALVGHSGAGKSTIINLLLKNISPQNGEIKIGEENLTNLKKSDWLKNISWIGQHTHLFYGSILENLLLAKETATKEEIDDVLKKADIYNYINSLPNKYDTQIGERGIKISGGEAQRIAIARAYLKNSPILIMDEPTANLDFKTESNILKSLEQLSESKTVITIAHRLNTIINADKIVVMDNGKIVEEGDYYSLINNNSFFKKLLKENTKEYV